MAAPEEKTFRTYDAAQGRHYAQLRPDNHPSVYEHVLARHAATGGVAGTLVDLGCGPGNVARALAPHFRRVYAVDPAPAMIAAAREIGGITGLSGEPIRFSQGAADAFTATADADADADVAVDALPPPGTVDLVTASNAAHWFDMPRFWRYGAAVALRPGGSIALWASGGLRIHPDTIAADAAQAALDTLMLVDLAPYQAEGNRLAQGRYRDLVLPWTVQVNPDAGFDADAVRELATLFPEDQFERREWTIDENFVEQRATHVSTAVIEKILSTGSPYTRWSTDHPDLVGTEADVLRKMRRAIESAQQAAGVAPGQESVHGVALGTVLFFKKRMGAYR